MSYHQPVLRSREEFTPGWQHGLASHLAKYAGRHQEVRRAQEFLECDRATAERVAFVAWLAEMRWLSDDPRAEPVRVFAACGSGPGARWKVPGRLVEGGAPTAHRGGGAVTKRGKDPSR